MKTGKENIEMFEQASRKKLRFETPLGHLATEDLWDLPLTGRGPNLDKIALDLARRLREEGVEESFVTKTKKTNETLQLAFDVVKHVIDVRLAENEQARAKADAAAKKERILEIIARKQDAALEGSSMEELQKMVEAL